MQTNRKGRLVGYSIEAYRIGSNLKALASAAKRLQQWFSNYGARPPKGAQLTFLQIKIKTALNQLEKVQKIKIHIEKLLMSTGFNYLEFQNN
jgi:hypothetical protein